MFSSRTLLAKSRFVCRSCSRAFRNQPRRPYSIKTDQIYDVVCVGGGPAGLSLLAALRESTLLPRRLKAAPERLTRMPRIQPSHVAAARCPRRSPASFQNGCLLPPADPVLEPVQLPHARLGPVPQLHRRLVAHEARAHTGVPRDAGLGRRLGRAHRV